MKLFRGGKDAATPEADDGAAAPSQGRGSSNLVPALVVAVGLVGGGYMFSAGGGGDTAAAAAPTESADAEVAEVATNGPVQNLEPITLNLADGRFLKVGLALQLAEAEGGEGAEAEELPSAKALDIAISLLGSYTMDELKSPDDKELVKKKLSERVAKAYIDPATHGQMVTKVYFTEFVMQ